MVLLAAGAAGAIGALGIILAFAVGGKPIYVMPLVFGFAPVINTLYTVTVKRLWSDINPFFVAGLILVAVGAATVLAAVPKSHTPAKQAGASGAATDHASAPQAAARCRGDSSQPTMDPLGAGTEVTAA